MSETPTAGEPWWLKPALALSNKAIFLIVLVAALFLRLDQILSMMAGAVITMAMNPDSFYWGSSASSARKDAEIANRNAPPAQPPGANP